jgi:hypothetical protein
MPKMTYYHMNIIILTDQPNETTEDRAFTQVKVRLTIENFNPRKAPGLGGNHK